MTRIVEATRIIEATRIVEVTLEPPPTAPAPAPAMFFPPDCLTRRPGIDYSIYDWQEIKTIGGCSYMAPSPDGKYLAYSTRACLDAAACGEAVKIVEAGSTDAVTIQFMPAGRKRWVDSLGWSSTGRLAVSYNDINTGVGVYVFGPPFVENPVEGEAAAIGGLREWNANRTAFVTFGATGEGSCNTRVSGYDFTTGETFPDIAAALGRDPLEVMILPYNSSFQSSSWWIGENEIPLLITPLEYDPVKEGYKFLPTMAARLAITPSGPQFTTLASSPTENYSFLVSNEGFTAQPRPYRPGYCIQ